jgi:hypothetical protein
MQQGDGETGIKIFLLGFPPTTPEKVATTGVCGLPDARRRKHQL